MFLHLKFQYNNLFKVKCNKFQMQIQEDFNPQQFHYNAPLPIAGDVWEELSDIKKIQGTNKQVYAPIKPLSNDWFERLTKLFGCYPNAIYDPQIANLPETITRQTLDDARSDWNKYVIKSIEDPTPVPPPRSISPERYLFKKSLEFAFREPVTEEERKIATWREGYGYLTSRSVTKKRFRVDFEHFFNIPNSYWSGIVLSLARERNTGKAIWGLRRDMATDFPFNPTSKGPTSGPFATSLNSHLMIENDLIDRYVEQVNNLTFNLENCLAI